MAQPTRRNLVEVRRRGILSSLVRGALSIGDLTPELPAPAPVRTGGFEADLQALTEDWLRVQEDLLVTFERVLAELDASGRVPDGQEEEEEARR